MFVPAPSFFGAAYTHRQVHLHTRRIARFHAWLAGAISSRPLPARGRPRTVNSYSLTIGAGLMDPFKLLLAAESAKATVEGEFDLNRQSTVMLDDFRTLLRAVEGS